MAKDPSRRSYRLRSTVDPAPEGHPLRRALLGIGLDEARRRLDQQARLQSAEEAEVTRQAETEQEAIARLTQETEQLRRRLKSLRGVVEVLREKLANERAAKAVLAARLLDRQAETDKMQQAAAAARMEGARLGADSRQEHENLRQLVAALYRSVAGRGPVPGDLEVLADIPPEPPSARGASASNPFRMGLVHQWHRFLVGKKAGRRLATPQGHLIVQESETIGPDNVTAAEEAGLLFELVLGMRFPERIPEL